LISFIEIAIEIGFSGCFFFDFDFDPDPDFDFVSAWVPAERLPHNHRLERSKYQ